MLWGKLAAAQTTAQRNFFGHYKSGTGNSYISFYMDSTDTQLDVKFGSQIKTNIAGAPLSTGTWYHLAITWSGTSPNMTYTAYVNGLQAAAGTNGNLQVLVEPTEHGDQLRMRTVNAYANANPNTNANTDSDADSDADSD